MCSAPASTAKPEQNVRPCPADEQQKYLTQRYKEAQENVKRGTSLVYEWTPIVRSCKAGLEALCEGDY